jgi:protein-tyrosine phosphatase
MINHQRLLGWEACINTRELGGYPIPGSGQVRWKAILRSDNLAYLTPAGQKQLLDYGIRTIIDLRYDWELKETPNPFAVSPNGHITYINIPLDEDTDPVWPHPGGPAGAMSDMYIEILERNRRHVALVLSAIVRAQPGGVLFHCYAGKDRTGLIAALVLSALGVPRETVVADYSFNSEPLAFWRTKILSDPALAPEKRGYIEVAISSYPETMQRTLEYLDKKYGNVENYLLSTALTLEDLRLLRQRLIEA